MAGNPAETFAEVIKGFSGAGALESFEAYSLMDTPSGGIYREFCWYVRSSRLLTAQDLAYDAWPKSRKDESRPDGTQEYFETLDGSEFSSLREACSYAIRFWNLTDTRVI